jgi:hypothetical protein
VLVLAAQDDAATSGYDVRSDETSFTALAPDDF